MSAQSARSGGVGMRVARIDCNPGPDAHERLRRVFAMLIQPTATESSHVLDDFGQRVRREEVSYVAPQSLEDRHEPRSVGWSPD